MDTNGVPAVVSLADLLGGHPLRMTRMSLSLPKNLYEAIAAESRETGLPEQEVTRAMLAEVVRSRRSGKQEVGDAVCTGAHVGAPVRTGAHEAGPEDASAATQPLSSTVCPDAHWCAPEHTRAPTSTPVRTGAHAEAAPPPPLHPSSPLSISLPPAEETDREEVQEEGDGLGAMQADPPASDSKQDREVFEAWCETLPGGGSGYRLNAKRREKLRARRREGYQQEQLLDAVRGWPFDPWGDRAAHNDLAVLLRDGSQVEKFARLYRERDSAPARPPILAPGSSPELLADASGLDSLLEARR